MPEGKRAFVITEIAYTKQVSLKRDESYVLVSVTCFVSRRGNRVDTFRKKLLFWRGGGGEVTQNFALGRRKNLVLTKEYMLRYFVSFHAVVRQDLG